MRKRFLIPLAIFLPVQIISTSSDTSVETHVSTTGDSYVEVESTVESSSNSESGVNVESTVENSNGESVYKKIEIEVNGEKKVLETSEPGTHTLGIEGGKEDSIERGDAEIKGNSHARSTKHPAVEYMSLRDYIVKSVKRTFVNIFSRIFGLR